MTSNEIRASFLRFLEDRGHRIVTGSPLAPGGEPTDRILELGSDDNFWQMGDTGPCGRCSEIYFVRGGTGIDPEIEIWNNVFMEFERSANGTLTPLPAPSIDTGLGLERMTAVMQGVSSDHETDCFQPLPHRISD